VWKTLRAGLKSVSKWLGGLVAALLAFAGIAWFHAPFATWLYVTLRRLNRPVPPVQIADNIYYVGASDLASFFITGNQGHVLIDSGSVETAPHILSSIRVLGFDPKDVKIILNSHGHFDHAGGMVVLKTATGARLYVSPEEKKLIEVGGRDDFVFGDHLAYAPAKVDHVLTDREVVHLGNIELTAHFTPGHTRGCTSWTMSVTISGKPHNMLLIGFERAFPLGALKGNTAYPRIVDDLRESFRRLEGLPCEVFLGPHASMFGFAAKRASRESGKVNAFVDPTGCAAFLKKQEQAFEAVLARQD
jgi:metallo-beta-lactamase class B